MWKKLSKIKYTNLIMPVLRVYLFFGILLLVNRIKLENIYNLGILYISFLMIIIEIKHKYRYKIMCLSFLLIITGVFIYLIKVNWIHEYIQIIVQLLFIYIFSELIITTLNIQEVHKVLKVSFTNTIEKKIRYRKNKFNYPRGYKKKR